MSATNVSDFLNKAMEDPILSEKIAAIHEQNTRRVAEAMASLSQDVGTPFTAEEFLAAENELTEQQLEGVAGGVGAGLIQKGSRRPAAE